MINDPWLQSSIMAKRGLARGRAGKRHELSIAAQGDYHYVYGPYAKPVLTIEPGDIVAVETEDAFGGVITSENDSPTAKLKFPFLNPQCGPIAVSGVEKGDCLAIHIHAVETRGAQPAGTTCIIPEFGGLVGTATTAMLNPPSNQLMTSSNDGLVKFWSLPMAAPRTMAQPEGVTSSAMTADLLRDTRWCTAAAPPSAPA